MPYICKVRRFYKDRGYGFLDYRGQEVFVHVNDIKVQDKVTLPFRVWGSGSRRCRKRHRGARQGRLFLLLSISIKFFVSATTHRRSMKVASIFGGGGVMIQAYVLGFFSPSVRARLQNAAKSSSDFPHRVGTKTCWWD